ncbi:glycoside hydrolase family 95 protein [Paenibacillus sp. D2_2]|uniref:glycoside hydrolase family 95 protein n=1 Tax=Paenibacillus sp. D2_2 TaxID=3073092 RepID=UPI002814C9E6|nr:glycoside hydrolase family 95 protein [Paenibacillus sp. D2_2]WMT43026.1 glycoside hydrolase family 95 protein [Paenibacillus sp. D2_2]
MNKATSPWWYDKPAGSWDEAAPIGNGKLGAMVFGHPSKERIALNEDSVWYGGPRDRNNPDALAHLAEIRRAIVQGELDVAHRLAAMALSGVPESQRHYMPLGDMRIEFAEGGDWSEYRRELDMMSGVVSASYLRDGVQYRQEAFASYPDGIMAFRYESDLPGASRSRHA